VEPSDALSGASNRLTWDLLAQALRGGGQDSITLPCGGIIAHPVSGLSMARMSCHELSVIPQS
jgi:hypothetical protein